MVNIDLCLTSGSTISQNYLPRPEARLGKDFHLTPLSALLNSLATLVGTPTFFANLELCAAAAIKCSCDCDLLGILANFLASFIFVWHFFSTRWGISRFTRFFAFNIWVFVTSWFALFFFYIRATQCWLFACFGRSIGFTWFDVFGFFNAI